MSFIKTILKGPAQVLLGTLGSIEAKLVSEARLRYRPVFIIGVPRSGTTLLCQLVNHTLSTCYFTNLALRLRVQGIHRPPAILSAYLAKRFKLIDRHTETFQSTYGIAKGWGNPSDTFMMWQHWFPNRYMREGELCARAQHTIYQIVAGTERVFDRPFVDKCTHNSIRIRALLEIFPTALFILCTRNPLAIAQSIYYGNGQQHATSGEWESARPKQYEQLRDKGIVEKVCGQVYFIDQNITEDLQTLAPERVLSVRYEDVCHTPQQQVTLISEFMNRHNAPTHQTNAVPSNFPFSNTRRVAPDAYEALIYQLETLYGHPMQRLDETP